MAVNDLTFFDDAMEYLMSGDRLPADVFHLAICDNTVAPAAGDVAPVIGDYTEVGTAGNYVAGGTSLGALSTLVSEAAGVTTIDSAVNPTWAAHASNDADAYWGIVYNYTNAVKRAVAFVDLGGPVDMSAAPITVTWHASGLGSITPTP